MKTLIIFSIFIALIATQGPQDGIAKHTWAANHPHKCLKFNLKYLPTQTSGDSCSKNKCTCATQGRVQCDAKAGQPGLPTGFGIHAINCTQHPYGEIGLPEMEEKFKINYNNFTTYHPFMDFNAGFWMRHPQFKTLIDDFQKDKVNFLALKWISDDDKQYYSIIFSPCGMQILEMITDKVEESHASLFKDSPSRFSFALRNNRPNKTTNYITILKISRSTESLDAVKKFYGPTIGAKMIKNETLSDGSEVATFMFDAIYDGVQLQFWQGRKPEVNTGGWTVKQLEDYLMGTHRKIMVSNVCGFDQYIDNHYSIDYLDVTLDTWAKFFEDQNLPYHWWKTGFVQIYGVDPTGWGIQVNSYANNAPKNVPYYSASCQSNDGCSGQGRCSTKDFLKQIIKISYD